MASKESIFDKLNLSSVERRLVMIVLVVLMSAFAWMVWRMILRSKEIKDAWNECDDPKCAGLKKILVSKV